jgi:hypothetical protein
LAAYADHLGRLYNDAALMVERMNHGHAVLLWLRENSYLVRLCGHDHQEGWQSSSKGKFLLYDAAADAFRNRETILHSFATFTQLASIEGGTLRAPEGEHDDRADAYALACAACQQRPMSRVYPYDLITSYEPEESEDGWSRFCINDQLVCFDDDYDADPWRK